MTDKIKFTLMYGSTAAILAGLCADGGMLWTSIAFAIMAAGALVYLASEWEVRAVL